MFIFSRIKGISKNALFLRWRRQFRTRRPKTFHGASFPHVPHVHCGSRFGRPRQLLGFFSSITARLCLLSRPTNYILVIVLRYSTYVLVIVLRYSTYALPALMLRSNTCIHEDIRAVLLFHYKKITIFIGTRKKSISVFLLLLFSSVSVIAEPYLAFKTNRMCSACHVNPIGGGARNSFGAYYGSQILPETRGDVGGQNPGKLSETFHVGGDLRFSYDQTNKDKRGDNDGDSKSFNTQSAQIYISLTPKNSRFSLYVDQQIAPGSAISREAYVLTKLKKQHYLKVGKMMIPYGLRLEDDSAYIRQATQINFDNSDNGVELGLEFDSFNMNLSVTNGTSRSRNDDDSFQGALRGEYLGNNWRLGSSLLVNDADLGRRTMLNVFGGFNWQGFVILAEVDRIVDDDAGSDGSDKVQTVSFFEVNKEFARGYNLKLTSEYLDPDNDVDENERVRHSVVFEYTPYAHFQLRGGIRIGEDVPERDEGNFNSFFMQVHMYY